MADEVVTDSTCSIIDAIEKVGKKWDLTLKEKQSEALIEFIKGSDAYKSSKKL